MKTAIAANMDFMQRPLRFPILPSGSLCETVLALGISTFDQLAEYVRLLPYGRTTDATDPRTVLFERRGTCSSKHHLLAAVAHECGHPEVKLMVGIYEMSEKNTPGVNAVLNSVSISFIPEAHCYLAVNGERFDFTGLSTGVSSPFDALIAEHVISPKDLSQSKVRLHMQEIEAWAQSFGISTATAWATREACIAALACTISSDA